jgi:SAM-dependent methyltransferase
MTSSDILYINKLIAKGLISGKCLELGVGYGGSICKDILVRSGCHYYGSDMVEGEHVDFLINFEDDFDEIIMKSPSLSTFNTILVLNVLEHCFNPIKVLDNAFKLLEPGGHVIVVTPTIWPLHGYPVDCWRPLPDFYVEYARRNNHQLLFEYFEYLDFGKITDYSDGTSWHFPPKSSKLHMKYSAIINRLFNTTGRGVLYPTHIAIGAVLKRTIRTNSDEVPE